jgi:SPP1 family predicted phage head-tail adaptor
MSNTVKNAGKYDKLIGIYSVINVKDADGFEKPKETLILSTYANVKTTKGYTLIQNDTDFEKAYTNFTIRYPAKTEITRDMFIKYNNKKYTIEYLNNINEDSIELEIQAKVVVK